MPAKARAMGYLLGIDNGGTLVKAVLFSEDGRELAGASTGVPVQTPHTGFVQRDMEVLWQKNVEVIRKAVSSAGVRPEEIRGVAVAGHGKGLYLWGKNQAPAHAGILSTDARADELARQWQADGTAARLAARTFQRVLPCQQVCLLKWMQQNEPEALQQTQWIFGVQDYIRFRLTGEAYAERTGFSGSNLLNLQTGGYDPEILAMLDLGEIADKLPKLADSTDLCGAVAPQAARETGLAPGTPCAAGMFDIDACAIAMGITSGDNIAVIAGTWSINEYIAKEPVADGTVMMNSLYCLPGYYLVEECSPTSAANHDWFVNTFMEAEKADCAAKGESIYARTDRMVESVSPEGAQLVFLPYLYGSNYDAGAKVVMAGLDSRHTKADMLRAVFEGIAFSHKVHLEKLLRHNPAPRAVRLAGGVCRSAVWAQMMADVFGLPVDIVRTKELGAQGAAMAAGVAAGLYSSLEAAASQVVEVSRTVRPNWEAAAVYRQKYQLYCDVSHRMEAHWAQAKEAASCWKS